MRRVFPLLAGLILSAAPGCGTIERLIGEDKGYVFNAFDVLAPDGEDVTLHVRLEKGAFLKDQAGFRVSFYLDGACYKVTQTNIEGDARVTFHPEGPGDYRFVVELWPQDFGDQGVPAPVELHVACRRAEAPIVIVDLDKTLVASSFGQVLANHAQPMPDSPAVMNRLAADYTILYLTHRPEFLGPRTKAWLREWGYPEGPVLLSGLKQFFRGSQTFKTRAIARIRRQFPNLLYGIGDRPDDALAYLNNGMKPILIVHLDDLDREGLEKLAQGLKALPDDTEAVHDWAQIDQVIYHGARFPLTRTREKIRHLIREMKD